MTGPIPRHGIEVVTLFEDPLRVLLPAQHRLAARPAIRIGDLRDETWIRAHDRAACLSGLSGPRGSVAAVTLDALRRAGRNRR